MLIRLTAVVGTVAACLAASAHESRVFRLERQPSGFDRYVNLTRRGEDVVFKQEPDYEGRNVVRGRLPEDPQTGLFTGYAWDVDAGTLYLDLNRNLDLTDDGPGAVHRGPSRNWFHDEFALRVPHGELELEYAVSLHFYFSRNRWRQGMQIKSCWAGLVELGGVTWQMGIVDNANGVVDDADLLLLRPPPEEPSDEDPVLESFDPYGDPLSCLDDVPRYLWLDGRAYEVQYEFVQGAKGADLEVTVTEREPPLSELVVSAPGIRRLLLQDPKRDGGLATVVVNRPAERVQIPAGHYVRQRLLLDYGGDEGFLRTGASPHILAEPGQAIVYPYGPPLRNTVAVTPVGRGLYLRHELLDEAGAPYSLVGHRELEPPRFTIERDGEAVFSGAFRYG